MDTKSARILPFLMVTENKLFIDHTARDATLSPRPRFAAQAYLLTYSMEHSFS